MPYGEGYKEVFWRDTEFRGLSGYGRAADTARKSSSKKAPLPTVILVTRDRIGFKYEREVGLNGYLSQNEAAKLLRLPVMSVNRWVRSGALKSKKRQGYSVVQLRHVLMLARSKGFKMDKRALLLVEQNDSEIARHWLPPTREME
jgi:hypothetical protein